MLDRAESDRKSERNGRDTANTQKTAGSLRSCGGVGDELQSHEQRFISAMDDDLNSSGALAVLFDLAKPLRALANRLDRGDAADLPAAREDAPLLVGPVGLVVRRERDRDHEDRSERRERERDWRDRDRR